MENRNLSRSSSITSSDSNNSSWSIVADENDDEFGFDTDSPIRIIEHSGSEANEQLLDDEEADDFDIELSYSETQGDEYDSFVDEMDDEGEGNEEEDEDEDEEEFEDEEGFEDEDEMEVEDESKIEDDISLVSKEAISITSGPQFFDAVRVYKRLDELSRSFSSPFNRMLELLKLDCSIFVIVSVATFALALTCYTCGRSKPKLTPAEPYDDVCNIQKVDNLVKDRYLGLQNRDGPLILPLLPSVDTRLKPSLAWSLPPSDIQSSSSGGESFSWLLSTDNPSEKCMHIATNQCSHVRDERQFSTMNEAVRRYLKHTEALKKLSEYVSDSDSSFLTDLNETLNDAEVTEPTCDGNSQKDSQIIEIYRPETRDAATEIPELSQAAELKNPKLKSSTQFPKLTLPIPPFSPNFLSIEPKFDFPHPIPISPLNSDPNLSLRRKFVRNVPDLPFINKPCDDPLRQKFVRNMPDLPLVDEPCNEQLSLKKDVKFMDEKRPKPRHANDLGAFFMDLKFPKSILENDVFRRQRKRDSYKNNWSNRPTKEGEYERLPSNAILSKTAPKNAKRNKYLSNMSQEHVTKALSIVKKAVSKSVERVMAHHNKLIEHAKIAADKMATEKQRKKDTSGKHQAENSGKYQEKFNAKQCLLNATCYALASFARTLATINLFPTLIGQTNAAKYISSLLDLSACTGIRLLCEKCWWTKQCCPKVRERCAFLPWQKHFKTKRFLISQHEKMLEPLRELGWPMPKMKHKGDHGEMKFEPEHPIRPFGSKKKMLLQQNGKKLSEWNSERSSGKNRKTGVH